jgi:uncharacterized protein (TIGR03084 family)
MPTDVIDDLEQEQDAFAALLAKLSTADWRHDSLCDGWSVADVVLHLAQTEEGVALTVAAAGEGEPGPDWRAFGGSVEEAMETRVRQERATSSEIRARWQAARRKAVTALRTADPKVPVRWVEGVLKPRTLATTRLAEHWAHALDIAVPLGLDHPDTERLRHIAWLAHSTLPYAFAKESLAPQPVYVELTSPAGVLWQYGPAGAPSTITGPAGEFCRVGARRLTPEQTSLVARGPHGDTALRILRNFAV